MRRSAWLGLLVVMVVLMGARPAAAASGFVISPVFQEVAIRADQLRSEYALQLKNQSGSDQNFRLSVADFGALDENGGVAFLGAPTSELEHRYGLASWMSLEKDAVFVPAGGSVQLTVTVENRSSLAPGGHYGAVLATAVTDTGQPATDPHVGVKQVLSSLILVTKEGGGAPDLKLVSQSGDGGWWRLPKQMEQRFQNAGNVHVVPRGVTEVRDPGGRVVKRAALNESSGAILPESFRRYQATLTNVATAWMPGRYVIRTTYRYDGTEKTKVLESTVWYAGSALVWGALALVSLGLAGGLWWWMRRRRVRV